VTSTRLLARNTALNLFGQVAPLLVAVIAVPILIRSLGSDRFGVLTLAWALIGYFGLFDFGIGRALTQAASEAIGRGDSQRMRDASTAAIGATFLLGVAGAAIMASLTPWLAYHLLKMDVALRHEAAVSFYLLAVSLPFVLSTVAFRGLFEAHQHFGLATALRLPFSLFNFVGPLLILPFSHSLVPIVATLVVGRVLTSCAHIIFGVRRYPWLRVIDFRNVRAVVPLFRLGGWMTVSNVISPMMVNLDRFAIGALLSMTAVAYYVTPFELAVKLLFIPAAVLGVFFPAFASMFVQDRERTALMLDRAGRFLLFVMFPVVLVLVTLAHEGLLLWVGGEYARQSTVVLQLLAIGVLINSFGQIPFALLQATGRADLTAKLHMAELPLYALMIFAFARWFGLAGVALAWTLRIALDTCVLSWLTKVQLGEATTALKRSLLWLGGMTAVLAIVAQPAATAPRLVAGGFVLIAFLALSWRGLLSAAERSLIRDLILRRFRETAPA
jgi:O-antigen/teichoic acid export membrane protein